MKIVIAHNHYGHFATGGEGNSAEADMELLKAHGHDLFFYKRTNYELLHWNIFKKAALPFEIIYSRETYREATRLFKEFKPDILHVNNYKYLFTPSIFQAAHDCGVKTVLTLRNYRLVCPCALLCCNGKSCERCLSGFPYRTLWNRCTPYETSFFQRLLQLYFYLGTSKKVATGGLVDAFISLTPFAKTIYRQKGIPDEKIFIKPNFMPIPAFDESKIPSRKGAVCLGRISSEKGVDILLEAWKNIDYPLTIIGDGPLLSSFKKIAPPSVRFTGNLSHDESMKILDESAFMVFPSLCYEGFPRTVLEALAYGVPVVASNLGARPDIVKHDENGYLYDSRNVEELTHWISQMISNTDKRRQMALAGRDFYMENYTPEKNYEILMEVYESVLKS